MGFLFDVKSRGDHFLIFVLTEGGMEVIPWRFPLPVYLKGPGMKKIGEKLKKMGLVASYKFDVMIDYLSGKKVRVLRLNTFKYQSLSRYLEHYERGIEIFNTGIPPETYFMILTGLFPSAKVEVLKKSPPEIRVLDSPEDTDWELPDLRIMEMFISGPSYVAPGSMGSKITLRIEGTEMDLEMDDPIRFLRTIRRIIRDYDPHVILTDYGDKLIFPVLMRLERAYRIKTGLNLEVAATGVSFVSYGTVFYRAPSHHLLGRWHIDRKNSFLYSESGLEGIVEVARISRIPVQRLARSAIGTAMSALEYSAAVESGILIPSRKAQSEDFRSLENLLKSDKGGLIFTPPVGVFQNVAEIDFSQMYPTIMVKFNVSPETVKRSGKGIKIPETGYVIDLSRKGIVPMALEKVLKKRAFYKKRKRESKFDNRQKAIKWILVTCFGYLGYRNARFGKIEAHETVTAIGRELLLRAKEIVEKHGFQVIHALTDSLWITGGDLSKVREIVKEISDSTGIDMDLEGIYRWLVFPSSKGMKGVGVPNRFFGVFRDGRIKVRGLMMRRHDVPEFVKEAQRKFIEELSKFRAPDYSKAKEIGDRILNEYRIKLEEGLVDPGKLAISIRVRRKPSSYRSRTRTFFALKILEDSGIKLRPGEMIRYIVTEDSAIPYTGNGVYDFDNSHYTGLLTRAVEEILSGWLF